MRKVLANRNWRDVRPAKIPGSNSTIWLLSRYLHKYLLHCQQLVWNRLASIVGMKKSKSSQHLYKNKRKKRKHRLLNKRLCAIMQQDQKDKFEQTKTAQRTNNFKLKIWCCKRKWICKLPRRTRKKKTKKKISTVEKRKTSNSFFISNMNSI